MFEQLSKRVTRWWWAVIVAWIAVTAGVKAVAPRWDDVTYDGDLAYLPETMPSYVGEQLLAEAFPADRAKSQIVLIVARDDEPLMPADLDVASDIARRFKNYLGATSLERAKELRREAEVARGMGEEEAAELLEERANASLEEAEAALDEAIDLDDQLDRHYRERLERAQPADQKRVANPQRLAAAYWNRARLYDELERPEEAQHDRQLAQQLDPSLKQAGDEPMPVNATSLPLLDVWTWYDNIYGSKLGQKHKHARLVVLHLSNEFMATQNIRVIQNVEAELAPVQKFADQLGLKKTKEARSGLQIGISGSAAVGGDMLRSAQESIKNTEVFTIIIVVSILIAVYRSPLLVIVPLITIFASLQLSMGIVALLTQLHLVPGFGWWDLKVFTTTKIFIVVILFGAGTDFCLFLISRFKEELEHGHGLAASNARSLAAVADALIASALTTILGLGMMFFADFGKYTYSGPVIGLCLFITLLACLTLAPALLRACGTWLFWPRKIADLKKADRESRWNLLWQRTARWIVAYPVPILVGSVLVLFPAAWHGYHSGDRVTYDFLSGLADASPSKSGTRLLQKHFPIGESGPLTVIVKREGSAFDKKEGRNEIADLAEELNKVEGVTAVRSITDPLGEFQPGERRGLFSAKANRARAAASHRRTAEMFVSQAPGLEGDVTRLELILDHDPFDVHSLEILQRVDERLREITTTPKSFWHGTTFAYAGATAGVRDLRDVTRSDNRRIQVLVVVAVLLVLIIMLRRPLVCAYMILSVLFSYYVTFGITEAFFHWAYGPDYPGLDWKMPLFLFVILVAVGEDYNVYLATRVYEEQKRFGPFSGLRRAIVRTGGIITSCGVIMAGTFISMTAGVWGDLLPGWLAALFFRTDIGALRGIVELGFALSLGVLLDTFIVRPILVPAFIALLAQWEVRRQRAARPTRGAPPGPHKPQRASAEESVRR